MSDTQNGSEAAPQTRLKAPARSRAHQAFLWLGVLVFVLTLGAISYVVVKSSYSSLGSAPELDWKILSEMDYITGKAPDSLSSLNGKVVKIPGFMVPLEDNQKAVVEFLLVPSPQACIHVPAPPPNQMVLVRMDQDKETEAAFGPIWVYGVLDIGAKRHLYGESSFSMRGLKIEPYQL